MHIFFSGIGGTGIGPLAMISRQAGYDVSGSDKQNSQYIEYLKKHGINDITIGQNYQEIEQTNDKKPIDWFVYSSSLTFENPNPPEIEFCRDHGIKISKRDELLNFIIQDKKLKLIAFAGTHGKSTSTAMAIYAAKQLGLPIGYSVGAKLHFGEMGELAPGSEYFIYECDEFDRNFLSFEPYLAAITGVSWDHQEIYPTREDYQAAFAEFISQSKHLAIWQEDADYLSIEPNSNQNVLDSSDLEIENIKLRGRYNRLDAWLVAQTIKQITGEPIGKIIEIINTFPGLSRRMEQIAPNLYSDYAHTVDKIRGAMSVASEMATESGQNLVIVYEGLHNRRQHYIIDDYKDVFDGASRLYWVPSYLAREDPSERIIAPAELISHLSDPSIGRPAELNDDLAQAIAAHLKNGDMVVAMSGGGGGSLDEWLRANFVKN
jgi:UDP-N-acetylmuramate--alanine ligase